MNLRLERLNDITRRYFFGQCGVGRCTAVAKVESFEKVATATGSFDAYRIEITVISTNNNFQTTRGELNFWYAPQVKITNSSDSPITITSVELAARRETHRSERGRSGANDPRA